VQVAHGALGADHFALSLTGQRRAHRALELGAVTRGTEGAEEAAAALGLVDGVCAATFHLRRAMAGHASVASTASPAARTASLGFRLPAQLVEPVERHVQREFRRRSGRGRGAP